MSEDEKIKRIVEKYKELGAEIEGRCKGNHLDGECTKEFNKLMENMWKEIDEISNHKEKQ